VVYDGNAHRSQIDAEAAAERHQSSWQPARSGQGPRKLPAFNCLASGRDVAAKIFAWEERRIRKINIAPLKPSSYVIVVNQYLKSNDFNRFR